MITDTELHYINQQLETLQNDVADLLFTEFGERAQELRDRFGDRCWLVQWKSKPSDCCAFRVVIGTTEGECIQFPGATIEAALWRFQVIAMPLIRARMRIIQKETP